MCSKLEQLGVETDGVTVALEHGTFQIVVEQHARHPLKEGERLDVSTHEEWHRRAQEEAQKDLPREAHHHDECPQHTLGTPDLQLAEMRPVDLRLLPWQGLEAQKGLGRLSRTVASNHSPKVISTTGVAPCLDHLEQAARTQPRVLLELLDDEGDERIRH
jgi:hypothetical protein